MADWLIDTERLHLRILRMQDKAAFFSYRSLEEVARWQIWRPKRMEEAEEFIRLNEKTVPDTEGTWLQLALCLPDGRLIGDIGIHFLEHGQLEIGYTLSPPHQHQGYAAEAVRAVIRYAFTEGGRHRITASADPANAASVRLLSKLGFRKEAHFVKSWWADGQWADECVFALLAEEWPG